jgi:hypothetical protein
MSPDSAAREDRFAGPIYKHAIARLWWMAELFRNGNDYGAVPLALMNQDIPNNLFRMDIAHHRPTVLAAVRVLEGKTGREANALAKAINSTATTLALDLIAPDELLDPAALERWVVEDIDPVRYLDEMPPGPDDPQVPEASIESMAVLLSELLAEAPVRGK